LLELKELELDRRSEELVNRNGTTIRSSANRNQLRETFIDQWTGDLKWADVIVNGIQDRPGDTLLQLPFDAFLERVLSGNAGIGDTPASSNLLIELNAKIEQQRNRLERWKKFHASMQVQEKEDGQKQASGALNQRSLLFQDHQHLIVDKDDRDVPTVNALEEWNSFEYDDIISSMQQELSKFKLHTGRFVLGPGAGKVRASKDAPRLAQVEEHKLKSLAPSAVPSLNSLEKTTNDLRDSRIRKSLGPRPQSSLRSNSRDTMDSHTQELDEYSRNSTRNPPKTSQLLVTQASAEGDIEVDPPSKLQNPPTASPVRTSLLERTRQSMSLLPNPNQRSHPIKTTKAPRPSSVIYPVNPFETPPKKSKEKSRRHSTEPPPPSSGASTPREELFSQEADYASVFKSRPRVALSPDPSPSLRWR